MKCAKIGLWEPCTTRTRTNNGWPGQLLRSSNQCSREANELRQHSGQPGTRQAHSSAQHPKGWRTGGRKVIVVCSDPVEGAPPSPSLLSFVHVHVLYDKFLQLNEWYT